ncbi:MAG: hypothetical protein PHH22_02390 [Clostridia bacterium]|nr:hypothetical protein [Clostridia bacterium]
MNIEKHCIEISKKGSPCVWETSDFSNGIGFSLIVANFKGEKKKALYIPKKSNISSFNNALIPIKLGDVIVKVSYIDSKLNIKVYSVLHIDIGEKLISLNCKAEYIDKNWTNERIANNYKYAIMAAVKSATSKNMQQPCYVKN